MKMETAIEYRDNIRGFSHCNPCGTSEGQTLTQALGHMTTAVVFCSPVLCGRQRHSNSSWVENSCTLSPEP